MKDTYEATGRLFYIHSYRTGKPIERSETNDILFNSFLEASFWRDARRWSSLTIDDSIIVPITRSKLNLGFPRPKVSLLSILLKT